MPANVSPEYEKAEQRYREAATDEERQDALQEMLRTIPKHKGTEKMQADIKRRLSKLRRERQKTGGLSKGPDPFHIPKAGAGQVVLAGAPNTGKSSLLAAATNARPKVGDYPFTTLLPQPGMWHLDDIPIQLVDTPPMTPDHVPAGLMGTIRGADLVCLVAEAGDAALDQIDSAVSVLATRNLTLRTLPRPALDSSNPGQRAGLIILNKAEHADPETVATVGDLYTDGLETLLVSAHTGQGMAEWFHRLWELLAMIRVYSKQPGRPADLKQPFLLPVEATVADLARQIHRDLPETMKYARLWGHSRFDGQQVHKSEPLQDRDVVEIHE